MSGHETIFDAALVTLRKERALARAEPPDFLLARAADDLVERLSLIKRHFATAAVVGAYTGLLPRRLADAPGIETVISLEDAPDLLARCPEPRALSSADALPFADGTLDLVASALALQLIDDLPGALVQMRRALKPDGLLLANLLGGDTLTELRQAWLVAESEIAGGASPRVAPFADVRALGGLLQRAGFALPVADSERVTVTYASPLALMQELRAMGMSNMLAARRRVPVSRRLLVRAAEVYEERFAGKDGRVPATFEIVTLTAWAPHESQQQPLRPGSAQARLADALGVGETPLPERGGHDSKG
jgi:SAM-dependent methyltransferase